MEKSFRLIDLDCANCAAKMERGINKIKDIIILINLFFIIF